MANTLPRNIFFSMISALVISIITPLYAQELPANIENLLTAQQLEDLKKRANQKARTNDNNLPVSKMPEQQNTRNLKATDKEKLKVEDNEVPMLGEEKKPLINYYYDDKFNKNSFMLGHKLQ